ncbi:MAG TPA: HRDC domain-containing protein [Solirubrobacteraceae bacterium]|nr:HRDC domain-containing protein [Solirubrobacteraceae bacterium]
MSSPPAGTEEHRSATILAELAELARADGRIAIDTEFMGEGRYRTLLCLIQIAVTDTNGAQRIELIDPLDRDTAPSAALQPSFADWAKPLADVLSDPAIEVIVHAGRQDIALLRRMLACEVRAVFDTQVAAGFIGMPAQCSYETLLNQVLGMRVAKSASFTRWDARPLSEEQRSYAREDVAHLVELASEIERRLAELGRLEWAREECQFLEQVSDERDLDTVFERLPRIRGLSATGQGIARELVQWRERIACERDRPVQSVLGDNALVEIAKRQPTSARKLEEIRGVPQGSLRRGADQVLAAIERGREREQQPLKGGPRPALPQPEDAPLIALSEALVRARAREADLAYELLAARADLQAIVVGERTSKQADVRTLRGWRHELVGKELLDLLHGRVSLSVRDRALHVSAEQQHS